MSLTSGITKEFLWTEAYRPKTIEDTILPERLKQTFNEFVDKGDIPNMTLDGTAGLGKTTVARAMLEQLGCDYIMINGSLNGNIDTLRSEIQQFASSVSLLGGRKYVILDEADYLNANSTQPALRSFIEEYSANCGFILTCNFKNRIIEPLHSRCPVIDFRPKKSDLPVLASQMMKRICWILEQEGIEYDKAVVAEVIKKYCPDWRRCIGEIQAYSATGRIDSGILATIADESYKKLIGYLKDKDFTNARKWVAENSDAEPTAMFRKIYDTANQYVDKGSIPQLIVHIAKYQYQAAFVADHEINLMAFLTEIMMDCSFK